MVTPDCPSQSAGRTAQLSYATRPCANWKTVFPCEKTAFPCEKTAFPCEKTAISCEKTAISCEKTAFPCEKTAFSCEKVAFSCEKTSNHRDEPAINPHADGCLGDQT